MWPEFLLQTFFAGFLVSVVASVIRKGNREAR